MRTKIDINTWKRKENSLFFKDFVTPFFSITVEMDVTKAYKKSKEKGYKFSLYCMYAALKAVNENESLRYRQLDGEIYLYDRIELNTPIARADHSFSSVILPYYKTFSGFSQAALPIIEAAERGEGDAYSADARKDTFVVSINKWYNFTGATFQIPQNAGESIPLMALGKMVSKEGRLQMPAVMNFHHGFTDGYNVGLFWNRFQELLDED